MTDYVEEYQEPRERWLHGYFNWTEEADITSAERHTARDGFDAGAHWAERQLLDVYVIYISPMGNTCVVPATSEEEALEKLRTWDYFDPGSLSDIPDSEMCVSHIEGAKLRPIDGSGIFLTS